MDFVEQVKSSVDIVKTIGEYVPLKKTGAGPRYTGLCPFHSEKTPSFSVHGGHQFYKCFGCGAGGDVFKFVMEIESVAFFDALKMVAERNGIAVPKQNKFGGGDSQLRDALLEMHEMAAGVFRDNLLSAAGAAARAYLASRGVAEERWQEFSLGLSDPSGQQLIRRLERHGFAREFLEKSGLVRERPEGGFYDYFRGRLMFPIHGESGQIIAFGGRALRAEDNPKYLNSPETPVYKKSSVLYNLHRARNAIRKQDRAVLVEGYMDVIGVSSAGVTEVVASCGTALTNLQVRAIRRHSERIVVNFDPDAAGSNAAERSLQMLLEENMRVRVLALDGGLDPDEYVKSNGGAAYVARLDAASGYFHWLADRARRRYDMKSIEGRLEGWRFLLPTIDRIADRLERMAVANDVAGYLGVDRQFVLEHFRKTGANRPSAPARPASAPTVPANERLLISAFTVSAEARERLLPTLRGLGAVTEFETRGIFEALFAMGRQDEEFSYAALEGRLGETDRALLSTLCLADEGVDAESAYFQAEACIRDLEIQASEMKRSSLENQVKDAEKRGDMTEALRLYQELETLPKVKTVRGAKA